MRDQRVVRCSYYLESEIEPARAAAILAGEQSSGTFVSVPGESAELHERHGAQVVDVQHVGRRSPSLPSRTHPEKVHAARVVVEWPMENIGTDLATLQTTIAGNLFELQELFACRVLDLKLPAELVVLSACETGLGKDVKGEGIEGLTRGFMYAGARRVVVSFWNVNDKATATLMQRLYLEMLRSGKTPAAALRAAQIQLLRTRQWQSPYYWAAFVMQGEWK